MDNVFLPNPVEIKVRSSVLGAGERRVKVVREVKGVGVKGFMCPL